MTTNDENNPIFFIPPYINVDGTIVGAGAAALEEALSNFLRDTGNVGLKTLRLFTKIGALGEVVETTVDVVFNDGQVSIGDSIFEVTATTAITSALVVAVFGSEAPLIGAVAIAVGAEFLYSSVFEESEFDAFVNAIESPDKVILQALDENGDLQFAAAYENGFSANFPEITGVRRFIESSGGARPDALAGQTITVSGTDHEYRLFDTGFLEQVADHRNGLKTQSKKTQRGILDGKLYDAAGERLVTVYARKKERRYRYYVSVSLRDGIRQHAQQGWRVPAQEMDQLIEQTIAPLLRDKHFITSHLQQSNVAAGDWARITHALEHMGTSQAIETLLQRVTLQDSQVEFQLSLASILTSDSEAYIEAPMITYTVPVAMKRRGVEMRLVITNDDSVRKDPTLIRTIALAHAWWSELLHGKVKTCAEIAAREKLDKGYVSRVLDLAFLAPDIVEAIVAGHQPAHLTAQHLLRGIKLPADWAEQRRLFTDGLTPQVDCKKAL